MGHNSTAKRERLRKEAHPEDFCPDPRCLWRASSGPCRKHPHLQPVPRELRERPVVNRHGLTCAGSCK